MSRVDSPSYLYRHLQYRDGHKDLKHVTVPKSIFLSIDTDNIRQSIVTPIKQIPADQMDQIIEDEPVDTFRPRNMSKASVSPAFRKTTSQISRKQSIDTGFKPTTTKKQAVRNLHLSLSSIKQESMPPTPQNAKQLLIINLKFKEQVYEVYYKRSGTVRQFLNYISKLRHDHEFDSCVCCNSDTLEILSLDFDLKEISSKKASFQLIPTVQFSGAEWLKAKWNRFQIIQGKETVKNYWVMTMEIFKEYEDMSKKASQGQIKNFKGNCWYFQQQYLKPEHGHRVRSDMDKYFPYVLQQVGQQLLKDDVIGFKIYKNFTYYIHSVGLKVTNISTGHISRVNSSLYRHTIKERHEQKSRIEKVVKFMMKTGFYLMANSLIEIMKDFFDIEVNKAEDQPQNQFIIQYRLKTITSTQFLQLLEDLMKNKDRKLSFLRDVWIYEFRDYRKPCTQLLQQLQLHNFQKFEDWFFPTLQSTTREEIVKIKQSMMAGRNIIEAYRSYLKLFDLRLTDSFNVAKSSTTIQKLKHPLRKAKHMQRIIICLNVVGMRAIAMKLITFIKSIPMIASEMEQLHDMQSVSKSHKMFNCQADFLQQNHALVKSQLDACSLI